MNWKRQRVQVSCVILAATAVAACDAGVAAGGAETQDAYAETEEVEVEALPVTAVELADAYDANEAAAQQRYGGQPLLVTGTVTGITLDVTDDPVVQMESGAFLPVSLNLADPAKPRAVSLRKGEVLTLRCESISEVIGSPILKECTFAEKAAANTRPPAPVVTDYEEQITVGEDYRSGAYTDTGPAYATDQAYSAVENAEAAIKEAEAAIHAAENGASGM